MTTSSAPETVAIPASHLDLLTRPICGVLTTMGGDGQPQSSLVWVDWDGVCARVNTTLERQKGRNLVANPKVSLLVVDPDNLARYLLLRGDAELIFDGALEHLDKLTRSYTRHPAYYGHIYPAAQRARETRVICRIHARRITLDAIHARAEPNRCAEEVPAKPRVRRPTGKFCMASNWRRT
jgi:PPOX class probable F420-dependent enzyme